MASPHGLAAVSIPQARPERVAVCFFGLVKNINRAEIEAYQRHVIDPLVTAGYAVDAFLHTQRVTESVNPRNGECGEVLNQNASLEALRGIFTFKDVKVAPLDEVDSECCPVDDLLHCGDPWPDNARVSLQNYTRQIHSIDAVASMLAASNEVYASVLLLRPDVLFRDSIDVNLLGEIARSSVSEIAIPAWGAYGGQNDRMAFGKTVDMLVYARRGSALRDYAQRRLAHAETFLAWYLHVHGIIVRPTHTHFARMRSTGRTNPADV